MHKDNKNHYIKTFLEFFLRKKSKKTKDKQQEATKNHYKRSKNSISDTCKAHLKKITADTKETKNDAQEDTGPYCTPQQP